MDFEAFTLGSTDGFTDCVLRLIAPPTVQHTPTHYVLLIDISESMVQDNKLSNVKRCLQILTNFLQEVDKVSLITFGEDSNILLNRITYSSSTKETIRQQIDALQVDGWTNISAGLANVSRVLMPNEKSGLLLLTDGHANRGVTNITNLETIIVGLKENFPMLSISSIAYGTDHNATLLKLVAEKSQGTYSIVDSIESTAFAFGDALGGLLSAYAQMVKVIVPPGTTVSGPLIITNNCIKIGDIYTGTKSLVLFKIPTSDLANCKLEATLLPSLELFQKDLVFSQLTTRDKEIELTKLRYKCSEILSKLNKYWSLNVVASTAFNNLVHEFKQQVMLEDYNGHPIADLLKNELILIERGMLTNTSQDNAYANVVSQHVTSIGLARGYSSPMPRQRQEDAQDPCVFQNSIQNNIASLMRAASQNHGT